ncbi:MAG: RdgB/HAM1 family non-canonical purine NTP pyrophosphatase [Cyanobacteria bacterium P01_F01_bin.42]
MRPLVVATQNPGKLAELQQYLQGLAWTLEIVPPELEIEEIGATFKENATLKATQAAQYTNKWAIADDSGLEVTALDGAPGLYSARYGASDKERIERLLRELDAKPDRSAQFVCVIAIASPDGNTVLHAEGICPGEILGDCQGSGGFGYDPIFWVPEQKQTYAQMTKAVKRKISHRGRAMAVMLQKLQTLTS